MPRKRAPQQLITVTAAADRLGLDDRTIRRYIADGKLRGYRVGTKLVRVDLTDVEALITPLLTVADA